ncbi:FAD/NAD(P)-binding protein [Luteolibacter yonseiensis]|uniref:FAD/NAD(P)-binding protein n=1 Tax=Luteolibacter yonseiensis TaxID=1144680 RepID=A0A934R6K9_9BACT|nr:FAD/NAD(P)-binding protein [Luteolibacter yonseiensis]MBK1818216.1 FAD/NAD(P)-binding protein [Luteolibacter yonseiensis]
MDPLSTLAIIGGGPSALFTLFHIHENVRILRWRFDRILVFEKEKSAGPGMPYSRANTSELNLSNISSEELPKLPETFAAWLGAQSEARLARYGIGEAVRETEIYPRVALGDYFQAQFSKLSEMLGEKGIIVGCHTDSEVRDIVPLEDGGYEVVTQAGLSVRAKTVIIATGHAWDRDEDAINLASPWPIKKLLPAEGGFHDFPIGLLGASLSAVDVINVLSHHHGSFEDEDGILVYTPSPEADHFKLVMHSADGLLSHLQFEQDEPKRELYRHCDEEGIQKLLDDGGHLRVSDYFDRICRPALIEALQNDGLESEAESLANPSFSFEDFAEIMKEKHLSPDPFELMKTEFEQERKKERRRKPTHWKEVLDDLMYTLNFRARLLPAEDHVRLKSRILPFVMNVMAALPLKSAKILMAVHKAGRLELVPGKAETEYSKNDGMVRVKVGCGEGKDTYEYRMFVDCSGQSPVGMKSFPFRSLVLAGLVSPAVADVLSLEGAREADSDKIHKIPGGRTIMELGGLAVTDGYQLISENGTPAEGLYDIAVPHIAGLRPYCYGLQACDEAAGLLIENMMRASSVLTS